MLQSFHVFDSYNPIAGLRDRVVYMYLTEPAFQKVRRVCHISASANFRMVGYLQILSSLIHSIISACRVKIQGSAAQRAYRPEQSQKCQLCGHKRLDIVNSNSSCTARLRDIDNRIDITPPECYSRSIHQVFHARPWPQRTNQSKQNGEVPPQPSDCAFFQKRSFTQAITVFTCCLQPTTRTMHFSLFLSCTLSPPPPHPRCQSHAPLRR